MLHNVKVSTLHTLTRQSSVLCRQRARLLIVQRPKVIFFGIHKYVVENSLIDSRIVIIYASRITVGCVVAVLCDALLRRSDCLKSLSQPNLR